ncbi:ABC transporter ATP-binding protein [Otariodibacter sp.]|uniref:ABC transporter ATP-binding protein n=1 Tax=Otariodibacter sp. TaxID=3030919 RepID=UPI00261244B3|nr:ABC transporter ATP-binding protein [Otariodibacter sp.]
MLKQLFEWFETRIDPYPVELPQTPKAKLISFIWTTTQGLRKYILVAVILSMLVGIIDAVLFQFIGEIVDWISKYSPQTLFSEKWGSMLWMITVAIVGAVITFLYSSIRFQTMQGVYPMRLRWNFHRLMLGQSMKFYQDEFAGRISSKVMQTALSTRDVVMTFIEIIVYMAVYFITSSIILVQFDTLLLIPFVLWIIILVISMRYFIPRLAKASQTQSNARSLMTGRITDAYSNISTIKLFSHGNRETDYVKDSMQEFMVTVHQQMRLVTMIDTVIYCNALLLLTLSSVIGLFLWSNSLVSAGAITTSLALALRLKSLAQRIMWEFARLFEHIGTVQDGMDMLSKPYTIVDKPNAELLKVTTGDIRFNQVNFAYDEKKPLLNEFNLHIRAGEKVGLVGRSGAGKSTLTNLLLRFYDIQSGQIEIDGQNIKDVTQESLRENIGLVTQDTSLLHRSIKENLTYSRPEATEEEILKAIETASAADFIEHLSDSKGRTGLAAHVGERGVKLSGGQRQRIAIARVMLKNAPILLLDEATSALDSEVEVAIQENLTELMKGKTVLAIAHRLSTIMAMDRLIVMDHGEIVEQGTHNELLKLNGVYAKLWAHQSGGFLID